MTSSSASTTSKMILKELKANKKELRVEKLKDKEEVEDLTQEMAELRYRTHIPRPQASSLQLNWQEWTFGGWMEVVKA
ncbi:hypothetical protein HN51_044020 [Arachis hypogaea]